MARILLNNVKRKTDGPAFFITTIFASSLFLAGIITAWGAEDFLNNVSAEESFKTAVAYSTGEGGTQDSVQAAQWMRRAATQGHLYAQFNLGEAYMNGYGVRQNHSEGIRWLQRAANSGLADAQVSLGLKYDKGVAVAQNMESAVKWFRAAARQGNRDGQNNLGIAYATGEGIGMDYVQAYQWFELARLAGHPSSGDYRENIASEMSAEQILAAQRLVRDWKMAHEANYFSLK